MALKLIIGLRCQSVRVELQMDQSKLWDEYFLTKLTTVITFLLL